jgi:general secretion pathway protein B
MSYILDAIKKSDHERQRHVVTSLVTPQSEFRAKRSATPQAAMWLMAGSLVVASGIGGALVAIGWRNDNLSAPATESLPEVPPVTETTSTPIVAAATAPTLPDPVSPAVLAATEPEPALGLLEIWQLTEAEQRYLAALDISMHVYSTEPAQRTVIVNGLRAREGQTLGQDIRLLEITSDGMILDFQGQQVHLSMQNAS